MSAISLDTLAIFLILLRRTPAAIFAVWAVFLVWLTLEAGLGAPGAAEVVGVVLAREALAAEGVGVVANPWTAFVRFFVAVLVHGPATLHGIHTLLTTGTVVPSEVPPARTFVCREVLGVFLGVGFGQFWFAKIATSWFWFSLLAVLWLLLLSQGQGGQGEQAQAVVGSHT